MSYYGDKKFNHMDPSTYPGYSVPRKKHRVFFWVFLAVQVLFLIWIISGLASTVHAHDCGSLDQQTCQNAYNAGRAIGVGIIIAIWAAVDFIVGICYLVYRLATR